MSTSVSESSAKSLQNATPHKEQLLQPGDSVGHSRVIELLAAGGMANVYKVWHEQLEVIRAIKILKPGFSDEAKGRLETEAKISANLRHPNIVEIYGMGFWNDIPYIEMEFIDGPSLKELLEKNIRLPIHLSISVAHRVCTALQFAYNQDMTLYGKVYDRLIHRDIKPANILLTLKGVVKLADFGIARPSEVSIHTVGSKVMGTFAYLSPEQLNGEKLDQRSDVYSLGTVLYEMLTGSKTFPQKLLAELVQKKSKGQFIPINSMGVTISRQLSNAIEKSLALDRSKRYCDAGEFDCELTTALHKLTTKNPEEIIRSYLKNPYSQGTSVKKTYRLKAILPFIAITLGFAVFAIGIITLKPLLVQSLIDFKKSFITEDKAPLPVPENVTQVPETTTIVEPTIRVKPAIKKASPEINQKSAWAKTFSSALVKFTSGDFQGAIPLFESIPVNTLPSTQKTQLLLQLLQAYITTGRFDDAQTLIENNTISDGLFYFLKSQVALKKNDRLTAIKTAQIASSMSSKYDRSIKKKATYQLASIFHSNYLVKPNDKNLQIALDGWNTYISNFCLNSETSQDCEEALNNRSLLER